MKINWKARFKNKVWLVSFMGLIIAFAYKVLGMFGIVPSISEDGIKEMVEMIIYILVAFGVVVDPTTNGLSDSDLAQTYYHEDKHEEISSMGGGNEDELQ